MESPMSDPFSYWMPKVEIFELRQIDSSTVTLKLC